MDEAKFEKVFGGKAGEQVPQVDPSDMKALWGLGEDTRKRHPEGNVAIGVSLLQAYCKPGANVMAINYPRQHGRNASTLGSSRDNPSNPGQVGCCARGCLGNSDGVDWRRCARGFALRL